MPDDLPTVDCHECKDLAFARNLVRQMKEGYGRHNSNRSFRYRPAGYDLSYGESRSVRVIGRVGDHALRDRWQDCKIGDAVPAGFVSWRVSPWIVRLPPKRRRISFDFEEPSLAELAECNTMTFERVSCEITSDDGRTFHTEHFWKRLS